MLTELCDGLMMNRRRESCRLTQHELAERTGNVITQAMVSRIESGEENVKIETLRVFAQASGCAIVGLLPEEEMKKAKFRTARTEEASPDRHPAADRSG